MCKHIPVTIILGDCIACTHPFLGSELTIFVTSFTISISNRLGIFLYCINILDDVNDKDDSTTCEDLKAIPKELRTCLDGDYWAHMGLLIDNTRPDLAINLDRFYWNDDNQIRSDASIVLSAIIQYSPIEPSYVLAAIYQVEPTITETYQQHASKATPQYGFHKGIKEFADEGR